MEEARVRLGDVIDRARLTGEPTLITRYGRPAAVVVSEDFYLNAIQVFDSQEPQDTGYREIGPAERPDWTAGTGTAQPSEGARDGG